MFKKYIKNPFQRQTDDTSSDDGISSLQGFAFMPQDSQSSLKTHATDQPDADVNHLLQVQKFIPPVIVTAAAAQVESNNEDRDVQLEDQDETPEEDRMGDLFLDPPEMVVGQQVSLKGELSFQNLVQIDGCFEGQINAQGGLIIGATGHVISPCIKLKQAIIAGTLVGDIVLENALILKSTACVTGNICARRLTVESGASIQGKVMVLSSKLTEDEVLV